MASQDYLIDYADVRGYRKRTLSGMSSLPPLIITVAITGAWFTKEENPNFPQTVEEQAQQTQEAYNAGASMVHVHRRKGTNPEEMSSDPEEYREINAMIREKCPDIIINNTAVGGRNRVGDKVSDLMLTSIYANPEVASLDTSNFTGRMSRKGQEPVELSYSITPSEAEYVAKLMNEHGVKPEFEIYDIGDLLYVEQLIEQELVKPPYWIQLLMHPGTNFPSPLYLLTMLQHAPAKSLVSIIGVGKTQFPMVAITIALGCHVRVGMEDNLYLEKGKLAESNAQFVEKVVRIAKEMGREIATPQQARKMIGISETPRNY